jgi:predicted RNase H-like HicB family nuclease
MTQVYKVVITRDTRGDYVATFPELVGCRAQAGSLKMLMERIQETMALRPEMDEMSAASHPAGLQREPQAREDL